MKLRQKIAQQLFEFGIDLESEAKSEQDLSMISGDLLKILASVIQDDILLVEFNNFLKLYTSYKIIEDVGMDNIIKLKSKT